MADEMSNDDIDALLAGGGVDETPPEEEKTTVSNDDIDALLAGGGADPAPAAEEKSTVSNDEIDALLAGGSSVGGDPEPSPAEEKTTVSNDDIDALLAGGVGVGESSEPAPVSGGETPDQKIIDLVESATSVGASAWGTLLNKGVTQSLSASEIGNPAASLQGDDLVGATIPVTGDASGTIYLTYTKTSASRVIGLMLMESEEQIDARVDKDFDDEDIDAFGEAINQWGGTVSQAWRDALGCELSFGPCDLAYGASFMQLLLPGAGSAIINCDFTIEGYEPTPAWLCLDPSLVTAWSPSQQVEASEEDAQASSAPASTEEDMPSEILGENLDAVLSIDVPIRVIIADKELSLAAARDIAQGSIIEFDKNCEEVLDVYIANQMIGRGEVIIRRERFGIQIKELLSLEDRIRMLGV